MSEVLSATAIIETVGECTVNSPANAENYVANDQVILIDTVTSACPLPGEHQEKPFDTKQYLERAGPRRKIFFDPALTKVGIVTCGGVCPGLNDVVKQITLALWHVYGVRDIIGLKYGYKGLITATSQTVKLTPDVVASINLTGGTFLGSSRGPQKIEHMVDFLEENKFDILFAVGGDGTLAGANSISQECLRRKLKISVIGVPKTIDNDIAICERTFGFETAVEMAQIAIRAANAEACSQINGIGLVKLMGRDSGFIARDASLASGDVNLVLIPEVPFTMERVTDYLFDRLTRRQHAVVVVAEGAGQHLLGSQAAKDKSGNVRYHDIGLYLKKQIVDHLKARGMTTVLKFIDPSYIIRSSPVNTGDAIFCVGIALAAVHAAMTGRTAMLVGMVNNRFVHIPLQSIAGKKKHVNPNGTTYQRVLDLTGTPRNLMSAERRPSKDAIHVRAKL